MAAVVPVLSVVPAGREVGEYLVNHPGVDKVTFTGSRAVGKRILEASGDTVKRVTLELGGKSPNIFFADVVREDDAFFDKALMPFARLTLGFRRKIVRRVRQCWIGSEAFQDTLGQSAPRVVGLLGQSLGTNSNFTAARKRRFRRACGALRLRSDRGCFT